MLLRSGVFNVSVLTEETPFEIFRHFGFRSGRDVDKFPDCSEFRRSENGVLYLPQHTNSYLSGRVTETADCGTHTLFTAEVTEAAVLADKPSVTYQYYSDHIKPRPKPADQKKKGFICKVCGYIYEGDTLPPDFICPVCKHGAEAFEPLP
jgi:flavin reductase (DIM6/NTAB) family NADH-FMN oxidoreductase RutF